jgi:protein-disulfide isomerase
MTNATASKARNAKLQAVQEQQAKAARKRKMRNLAFWGGGLLVIAGLLGYAMLNSRPSVGAATKVAPPFSLTDTAGKTVTLADYKGRNVILFFSEGAGCQACLLQMSKIEADKAAFDKANVTVRTRSPPPSCSTTAPCPRSTAPSGRACTRGFPGTASC